MNRWSDQIGYEFDCHPRYSVGRGWSRYRWVEPNMPGHQRTKEEYPYAYSAHYLFGERSDDASAVYSDRLSQWDHDKFKSALGELSRKHFNQFSPKDCSDFLSRYFGREVECVALAEECNVGNGYPLWIFWFRDAALSAGQRE
jgi:hypothetical protein